MQEDFPFGNMCGDEEPKLLANDFATLPTHFKHWHFQSLVFTGRDVSHLKEMLNRYDHFLDSTPVYKNSQITATLRMTSIEQL